jgi:uncharacterized repeat protein (TIGR03803 family)
MIETLGKRVPTLLFAFLMAALSAVSAHGQNFATLYDFYGGQNDDGQLPVAGLLERNGILYGTTQEGGSDNVEIPAGTVFAVDITSGKETMLYTFSGAIAGPDGALPSSGLVADAAGDLYGTTIAGGSFNSGICSSGCGIIFKVNPSGEETILYTFTGGADGLAPNGIIFDRAGNLYGTARWSGQNGECCGTVFKLAPNGTLTTLYTFTGGADGYAPAGSLVLDESGNLYGATSYGGNTSECITESFPAGCGVIFKIGTNGDETVLYTFTGGTDGAEPNGSLLLDASGNLYGTAFAGGNAQCNNELDSYPGCGVVFELTASGSEKVLHAFRAVKDDGANPDSGLARDSSGDLFGTTLNGGAYKDGTVFQVNAGKLTLLHSFHKYVDGWLPQGGVVRDDAGNLYGTAAGNNVGCPSDYYLGACGTVFKVVAPPQITKFAPASGPVGSTVSISGASFSQTTEVTFNGTATTFTVKSDKLVTATVPTGATTGKIAIVSPGGTATTFMTFTVTQ